MLQNANYSEIEDSKKVRTTSRKIMIRKEKIRQTKQ